MTDEQKRNACLRSDTLLLILTVASVVLGVSAGIAIKMSGVQLTPRQHNALKFPGEIFLRMLQLLVVPLMFSSLVSSLASLETKTAGKLAFLGISYYSITIVLAVTTGIVLVLTIKPGAYSPIRDGSTGESNMACKGTKPSDAILDLLRNIFPDNIIEATFRSKSTCLTFSIHDHNVTREISFDEYMNLTDDMQSHVIAKPYIKESNGLNILGIIVFALFIGGAISTIGKPAKPLKKFFNALEIVIMRLVSMAICFAPVGIFFLIAQAIAQMDDLNQEVKRLGMFVITLLLGFAVHSLFTLQVIILFVARRNPIKFTCQVLQALLTAFATASSSATMPLTLKCLEENVKSDKRVTKFLIPLGATVNMNGTALYEAVAAIYIAQCLGVELTIGKVIVISFTSVLASVGASGIPHAGMITMIMVLIAIGLPPNYFTLVIPVDWFIDRFRTTINVYDDMIACIVVEKYCKSSLKNEDVLPITYESSNTDSSKMNQLNEIQNYNSSQMTQLSQFGEPHDCTNGDVRNSFHHSVRC